MKNKKIIFDDDIIKYMDQNNDLIINELQERDMVIDESNALQVAHDLINYDYEDIMQAIKDFEKKYNIESVYVHACFGLWYGKRQAHATFKSLIDAISRAMYDVNMLYFSRKGATLALDSYHHDGCNNYKFYYLKNGKKYAITYDKLFN